MPYPYKKQLLMWPCDCEKMLIEHPTIISADGDENCIAQVISGRAMVHNNGTDAPANVDAVLFLGRNFSVTVESVPEHPCQLMLLRLRNTNIAPGVDINHLCITMPMMDAFFSNKTRFCILTDREYIRNTFMALALELHSEQQEKEHMIHLLLQELFIRLARSFHAHAKPSGVQFFSQAREYIRLHFQEELSIDDIAAHVGISRSYLAQLFAIHMGYSPVAYIQAVRCDHAAYLLRTTRFAIVDIALEVGFNSRQHFARTFSKIYGIPPQQYRSEQRLNGKN